MLKFKSAQEWVTHCKTTVRRDLDNFVLFTGTEGAGKSTWKYQVGKQLDPHYGVDRIFFSSAKWIAAAPQTPKYGVRDLDELFGSGRMAMRRESIELDQHLQICRQFNHHMLVAYPRARRLDGKIAERVRWRWDVPRRGMAVLYYLSQKERVTSRGVVVTFRWVEVLRCGFRPNPSNTFRDENDRDFAPSLSAPCANCDRSIQEHSVVDGVPLVCPGKRPTEWDRYLLKKNTEGAAASMAALEDGDEMGLDDDLGLTGGVDRREAVKFFRARLEMHQENALPGASINEAP